MSDQRSGPTDGRAPWQDRVDRARAVILGNRPGPVIENQLATVERSLVEAEGDRRHLRRTVADLQPERVSADLKAALRSPDVSDTLVTSLRRRHETVNDLLNRLDRLDQQVEATVADLETLAARTSEIALRSGTATAAREIEQLGLDVEALAAAHREIEHL